MLQIHYIAKVAENISVTVLSFCANYMGSGNVMSAVMYEHNIF